jgi:hypothetical protein
MSSGCAPLSLSVFGRRRLMRTLLSQSEIREVALKATDLLDHFLESMAESRWKHAQKVSFKSAE